MKRLTRIYLLIQSFLHEKSIEDSTNALISIMCMTITINPPQNVKGDKPTKV